ncbi:B-cadherin-like isoform X2 [Fundulus heteroclitus]|uniref:B-cadherin-like isoform X2 n=1 Tax=Fundulus heteroclitus TaxID=8078 RepID=UPI00165AA519|nr:B-cadherin-like isoform X2 [Fundulus heteroclitus]
MKLHSQMGTAWFAVCGVFFVFFQIATAEESPCVPGFESELLIFKVNRKHLRAGTSLGKVAFTDCTHRKRFLFSTDDSRFVLQTDGLLTVKREVVLHEGHRDFFIHSWDSQGQKLTVPAMVLYHGHRHGNDDLNTEHHHDSHTSNSHNHDQTQMDSVTTEDAADPQIHILDFPKSSQGLKRRKRGWVIPPLSVSENHRGPYPLFIAQIRSDEDKTKTIHYSVTGPGADAGLFTMDRVTGYLYVTQELDREKQEKYVLEAHAVALGSTGPIEKPMEVIVYVIDQNDNKPVFNQSSYVAEVPEASPRGVDVIQVVATDADDPRTDNGIIRYKIISQQPEEPSKSMFIINPVSGGIRVDAAGLDREKFPQYKLRVQVADLEGEGLAGYTDVIIKVTDSNDHAPAFTEPSYAATVEENKADAEVVRMSVTDGDEPHSPAWNAKFKIIDGDPGKLFTVKTSETNRQEGIITTAKGLDFEKTSKHTLLVMVENEIPFAVSLPTSTITVVVTVKDVNEPPIFEPETNTVSKKEDLAEGSTVVWYTASDPDTARKQKVMYKVIRDQAGWFNVDENTGEIKLRSQMDRESLFIKDDKYTALIGAYDDDQLPATGTGTLVVVLEDVNDNAPIIEEREIKVCNKNPDSLLLTVTDKDGPGFTSPYSVILLDSAKADWTARMNNTKTGIILTMNRELESRAYNVGMNVFDHQGLFQANTVKVTVCDCSGTDVKCLGKIAGGSKLPVIMGILGGILLLLMLVLLLLLLTKRKKPVKEPFLLQDDFRDDIFYYDEEGGGEDDQDYDLGVLHRGLDNRPEVFRNDVAPVFLPAPVYKPRPANPDDIGNFIDDNLKAADSDPTAPPYDSLLVFDYEGGGSEAGSLSSLNSSSDGDQDYDCLNDWGPRFKKLADMYGGDDAL